MDERPLVRRIAKALWDSDRAKLSPKWEMPAWSRAPAWRRRPYLLRAQAQTQVS